MSEEEMKKVQLDYVCLDDDGAKIVGIAISYKKERIWLEKVRRLGSWCGSVCSSCGKSVSGWYDYAYCPFCGSKNEESEESNDKT